MRVPAAVLACLVAGIAPIFAQTAPNSAEIASTPPAAAPASRIAKPACPAGKLEALAAAGQTAAEQAIAQWTHEPATAMAKLAAIAVQAPGAKPEVRAAKMPFPDAKPAPQAETVKQAAIEPTAQLETEAMPLAPVRPVEQTTRESKTASAACPGNPEALGTERVLTISSSEFQRLGTINYKVTLPLNDHEVVLTFDDGPIPPYTNSVLDTLAANCVKATYFLVGEMAQQRPYLVRRIYNEGHSIGSHSQTHPFAFQRLSMKRVERQVETGIASVNVALGDPRALSPFFRIPGFGRTNAIDQFLEHKGLITWSADVDTDDWKRGTTPSALIKRTMKRLNARGRGIILMHDIHPDTALALPKLLKELKNEGYRVVHVVAAGEHPKSLPEVVASPAEKEIWPNVLHAKAEKSGAAMSALRHRVKKALARHRHRHHHRTRSAKAKAHHSHRTRHANARIDDKRTVVSRREWRRHQY